MVTKAGEVAVPVVTGSLSPGQQRVWFLHELHPSRSVCTVAEALAVTGTLQPGRLRDAFVDIADRHEALRCVFTAGDDHSMPRMIVRPSVEVAFTISTDPTSATGEQRQQAVQRWANARTEQPFDVCRGPLWRVDLRSFGSAEHVLLLSAHQLIADRRSLRIMLEEAARIYTAVVEGQCADLSPAPSYLMLAESQRHELADPRVAAILDIQLAKLASLPASIELPMDRQRPPALSLSGSCVRRAVDPTVAEEVESLARAHGVSVEVVLLAALAVLTHRYTGVTDIVIGMPSAGPQTVVGPLTTVLVLQLDLAGDPPFNAVLTQAGHAVAEAAGPRNVPFEMLVERLQPDRDLSQRPVCQLGFEGRHLVTVALGGATGSALPLDRAPAAFDLALVVTAGDSRIGLSFEYDTDLFKAATITRLADNYHTLLASAVAQPSERIRRQHLLAAGELRALAVSWNDTRVEFPTDRLVHQLIADQAARRPDATALVARDGRLTYGQLNRRANQVAQHLRTLAVGPQVPVGVLMKRSMDMVVAVLGVLKTGGAVVLLDPAQPERRINLMLDDSRAPVLLTTEELVPDWYRGHVRCLDRDEHLMGKAADTNPEEFAHPESVCQIAYTSGSTGEPRGVVFRHGAVLLVSYGTQRAYSLTELDQGTWISAPGFGISFVNELWPFLTTGATVHIADETTLASPFRLRDWMLTNEITVTLLTKVLAERLCAVDWPRTTPLRVLMVSGERVGWLPSTLPFEVVTIYGSTETTNATTCLNEADGLRLTPKTVPPQRRDQYRSPVGRPVPNATVYVLDDDLRFLPIGVPGQLFVGGELIQSGYLYRSDATALKWLPDPFAQCPGARMVATGDIGRVLADGTVDILGRADDQVSFNGHRIELGEVSSRMLEHAAVQQAVVVIREDEPGERRLVGYVVPQPPHRPGYRELRELLKDELPAYMVPTAFVVLDALPLLPNGKLDRQRLPAPDAPRVTPEQYVAPSTAVEKALADAWKQVLRQERVGVRDNYFDLGGDSLTGMELMASIEAQLGVDLPLRTLFDAPTVEDMAMAIERARAARATGSG